MFNSAIPFERKNDFTNISLLVLKRGKKYVIILQEIKYRIIPNKKGGPAYQAEKIISKKK